MASPILETTKLHLTPYMESIAPMVESSFSSIKTKAEETMPDGMNETIQKNVDTVVEQVTHAMETMDTMVCGGLDQLTAKIPALKEKTPELVQITKVRSSSRLF